MKTRTVSRRNQAATPVTVRTAGWITAGLLFASAALGPAARGVAAASVDATPINNGNATCADFAPQGSTWAEFKLEGSQLTNGSYGNSDLTVTISNYQGSSSGTPGSFDWSADHAIDAVFVKAGSSKHNLFVYDPAATSDTGLGPQSGKGNGISHISFCYGTGATNPPATSTPTAEPTQSPSSEPTDPPSSDPTDPPATATPSVDPTESPSSEPTESPSGEPTDPPATNDPNGDPTSTPSDEPSATPSDEPSADPSATPSTEPTVQPTDQPSTEPTDDPTSQPSVDPTEQPSSDPTARPTDEPSADPTEQPSSDPSDDPSASPTSEVLGATSGPMVTPPPTDTLSPATSSGQVEAWRIVAIGLALVLVSLLMMPARPSRSRARG